MITERMQQLAGVPINEAEDQVEIKITPSMYDELWMAEVDTENSSRSDVHKRWTKAIKDAKRKGRGYVLTINRQDIPGIIKVSVSNTIDILADRADGAWDRSEKAKTKRLQKAFEKLSMEMKKLSSVSERVIDGNAALRNIGNAVNIIRKTGANATLEDGTILITAHNEEELRRAKDLINNWPFNYPVEFISEANRSPKIPVDQDPKKWAKQFLADYKRSGKTIKFMPIAWEFEDVVGKNTGQRSKEEGEWVNTAFEEIRKLADI